MTSRRGRKEEDVRVPAFWAWLCISVYIRPGRSVVEVRSQLGIELLATQLIVLRTTWSPDQIHRNILGRKSAWYAYPRKIMAITREIFAGFTFHNGTLRSTGMDLSGTTL